MLEKEKLSLVREFAIEHSEEDDIHGFLHVERVLNLCLHLGKKLDANLLILKISALLHDIGRKFKANDMSDFRHAQAALPYFDYFFTEHSLRDLVLRSNMRFDVEYHCVVESHPLEAISYQSGSICIHAV